MVSRENIDSVRESMDSFLKSIFGNSLMLWVLVTREGYEVLGNSNNDVLYKQVMSATMSYIYVTAHKSLKRFLGNVHVYSVVVNIRHSDKDYSAVVMFHPLFFLVMMFEREALCKFTENEKEIERALSSHVGRLFTKK
ncbi:MAG TPA: hypothetical protein ENK81_03730 [Euryarchaeota archaeon]|nr:hypothetical protein [Euryarchaeota archaeon]